MQSSAATVNSPSPRWRGWAIAAASSAALLVHNFYFDHFADDAYISLRYADNWLRGEGLVFNPGEPVMGYSNFAWVVAMATLGALGIPLITAAKLSGLVLSTACVVVVCRWASAGSPSPLPAAAAGLWLAASGPFALWAGAGLEGPLFALCLLIGVLGAHEFASTGARLALAKVCAALCLATLTRPEGAGYAVALGAWFALRPPTGGLPTKRTGALACIASGVIPWLGLAAFGRAYYGDALPNTYYAKTHPISPELLSRSWLYTMAYLNAHAFAPLLVLVAFAGTHARKLRAEGWAAFALIGAFLVYYVRIGGDALVYYRMWAWMQPLFALLLASSVATLTTSVRARTLAYAGLLVPLLTLPNSLQGFEIQYLRSDDARIRSLGALGRELRELPPTTRLAANVIGAIGFESRLPVVDMLGLVDRHIARAPDKTLGTPGHESHDGAYVLDQKPDLIFVGIPRATAEPLSVQLAFQPSFPSDRDLANDPRLQSEYAFQHLVLPDGRLIAAFVRRGYSGLTGADSSSSPTR